MKTLPTLKVKEETIARMEQAIKKTNDKSLAKLNFSDFRRLSYEFLSQMILQEREIPFELLPE